MFEKVLNLIFPLTIFLVLIPLKAQDLLKVIVFNEEIGFTLSREENEKYHIFNEYDNFLYAYILVDTNDYKAIIGKGGVNEYLSETKIALTETNVQNILYKIDYLERGSFPKKKRDIVFTNISLQSLKEKIDEVKSDYPQVIAMLKNSKLSDFIIMYPRLQIGVGLSYFSPYYDDIQEGFWLIDDALRRQGYEVGDYSSDLSSKKIHLLLSCDLEISKYIAIAMDLTHQLSGPRVNSAMIRAIYNFDIGQKLFNPFIGLGVAAIEIKIERHYGLQLEKGILDNISVDASNTGAAISGGLRFNLGISNNLIINMNYMFFGDITTDIVEINEDFKTNLSGFSSGIRLSIVL